MALLCHLKIPKSKTGTKSSSNCARITVCHLGIKILNPCDNSFFRTKIKEKNMIFFFSNSYMKFLRIYLTRLLINPEIVLLT